MALAACTSCRMAICAQCVCSYAGHPLPPCEGEQGLLPNEAVCEDEINEGKGKENKPRECPAGHRLKRLNIGYIPGACDGCKTHMKVKEWVMDCCECNYYLCQSCCPQDGRRVDDPEEEDYEDGEFKVNAKGD